MVSSSSIAISASALAAAFALSATSAPLEPRASSKRGIAWPYDEQVNADIFSNGCSWTYSYEHFQPGGAVGNGMEFVVMQRTAADSGSSPISQLASAAANSQWVMGFNEPDNPNNDGSNLSPQDAANAWKQYIQPLKDQQGKKLVAPAVTSSSNEGQGISWLDAFVEACDGCTFDAYAFHPYAADADAINGSADYFTSYQNGKYTPSWITEFGRDNAHNSDPNGAQMIQDVINHFEGSGAIQRYAYISKIAGSFNAQRDLQVSETSSQLTDLGNVYNQ